MKFTNCIWDIIRVPIAFFWLIEMRVETTAAAAVVAVLLLFNGLDFLYLQSSNESEPETEPQSIFLEGALPHESQILVADSKTTPEGVYNEEINGNSDEPAVRLLLISWKFPYRGAKLV